VADQHSSEIQVWSGDGQVAALRNSWLGGTQTLAAERGGESEKKSYRFEATEILH